MAFLRAARRAVSSGAHENRGLKQSNIDRRPLTPSTLALPCDQQLAPMNDSGKRTFPSQDDGPSVKAARGGHRLRQLTAEETRRTNDEIHSTIELCPVTVALMDTPQFQRLRGIRQLGTSELVFMNCNHARFEHSVGVSSLAEHVCRIIKKKQPQLACTEKDVLCVKLAGLLHDVGHGPFSHLYEMFLTAVLPTYLLEHPDLQTHYDGYEKRVDLKRWCHEEVSLNMIDAILEHLGLKINLDRLDEPLEQIGDGVDARSMRVHDGCTTKDEEAILTSRDFVFIKECIYGKPISYVENRHAAVRELVGRPQEKEWMYDIVSNVHSGLDVDKLDYFARDQRRALRQAGEIYHPMIEGALVAWGECPAPNKCRRGWCCATDSKHLMVCYPEKMKETCSEVFKKRFELHSKIYKHKTVSLSGMMICDILCYADPFFRIPTTTEDFQKKYAARPKSEHDSLPLSLAVLDIRAFERLKDSVLDQIANSTDPNLKKARALAYRLHSRDLYKRVSDKTLDMTVYAHQQVWAMQEYEIKQLLVNTRGEHDKEDGGTQRLTLDDFSVEKCSKHHGAKDANPLKNMRFVMKPDTHKLRLPAEFLPTAVAPDEKQLTSYLPQCFQENSIRVFCRNPEKIELAAHIFESWFTFQEDNAGTTPDICVPATPHQDVLNILTQEDYTPMTQEDDAYDEDNRYNGEDMQEDGDENEEGRGDNGGAAGFRPADGISPFITPPRCKRKLA